MVVENPIELGQVSVEMNKMINKFRNKFPESQIVQAIANRILEEGRLVLKENLFGRASRVADDLG